MMKEIKANDIDRQIYESDKLRLPHPHTQSDFGGGREKKNAHISCVACQQNI